MDKNKIASILKELNGISYNEWFKLKYIIDTSFQKKKKWAWAGTQTHWWRHSKNYSWTVWIKIGFMRYFTLKVIGVNILRGV